MAAKRRVSGRPLTAAQTAQRSIAAKASAAKRKKGFGTPRPGQTVTPHVSMPVGTVNHTVHPPANHPMGAGPPMDGAMHNRIKATTPPRNGVHETDTGTGVKRVKYKNGKAVGASFVKHTSTGRDYRTF